MKTLPRSRPGWTLAPRVAHTAAACLLLALLTFSPALSGCDSTGPQRAEPAGRAPRAPTVPPAPSKLRGEVPRYRQVVAADHALASAAGLEILRAGGNAVDAAVATSFALSVVRPYSCGIGGGGFMLIHIVRDRDGVERKEPKTIALDYREHAPSWAAPEFFENDPRVRDDPHASTLGGHAVAIPGTVAGLLEALDRFGTMSPAQVLAPAVRLARDGYDVDADYTRVLESNHVRRARETPEARARFASFLDVYPPNAHVGWRLRQPQQATALERIAADGRDGFYAGPVAAAMRSTLAREGVTLAPDEFQRRSVRELRPIDVSWGSRRVRTMPPPSSGGIVLAQTLGMLERREPTRPATAARVHVLAEALKHAFADRSRWMADPGFVAVPVDALLAPANLDDLARRWNPRGVLASESYGSVIAGRSRDATPLDEDHGTSHLSVIDAWGNAVACTETVNLSFGSLLSVTNHETGERFGFVLNNQMDDFTTRRGRANAFGLTQDDRNLPAPGKKPLSSMSPTIVLSTAPGQAHESVEMVVGGSGGPRIITGTLQAMLAAGPDGLDAHDAVSGPRVHHQYLPDVLTVEESLARTPDSDRPHEGTTTIKERLIALGQNVREGPHESAIQIIRRSPADPRLYEAASDPRKGGRPAGD